MKIPYGISDFNLLRSEGYFYADKTPLLPLLERVEAGYRYVLFLRPRRIGKSLLLSTLEHYYDLDRGQRFDELFGGLWVHAHPTAERNRYLVLKLDFSPVNTDGDAADIQRSFTTTVKARVLGFVMRYTARIPQLAHLETMLHTDEDAAGLMSMLLAIVAESNI